MAWLRWVKGRQNTGYEKMLLLQNPFVIPFDFYLLRYKPGTYVPPHIDPIFDERRHYRINVILKNASQGGVFECKSTIVNWKRFKMFRPDLTVHSVSKVTKGTRYVLSIGWAI